MPTYEYACSSCHHEWEAEQSIKEAPLTECPTCHEHTARRQISRGVGFILKGSGWYSDLYSGSSNKPETKTSSESGSSAETGTKSVASETKSESGDKKSDSSGSSSGASSPVAASSSAAAA